MRISAAGTPEFVNWCTAGTPGEKTVARFPLPDKRFDDSSEKMFSSRLSALLKT
jgi:hypothetical protein